MENSPGMKESCALSEVRIILIGGRWSGKSSSGNTILRRERFECGRTRTAQSELRHEEVEGRELTVVDAPGWSSSLSLTEIPEGDKQAFKLNVSKCPPGPHAFLLVTALDSAFSMEERRPLEHHMKLLGERVWRHTMVLFTCGDYLGKKTIEQHIENEGEALKWLVNKCGNRYHVFNNKDKGDSSQVMLLLEKIDEMVWHNNGGYYCLDERIFHIIQEKQREAAERADKRRKRAEEQRQQMKPIILDPKPIPDLRIVLLGSRNVGKTSMGNTILGIKEQESGKRTIHSAVRRGYVNETAVILVDTPGWWKGFSVSDTTETIKQEVMSSMFLCRPGPHVFLLVIDADASFNERHRDAATGHLELLGEDVWKHTIAVFTRGDWLGAKTIEEYIEGEGEALRSLVDKCGNRYHVIDNKNKDDGTQVTELLEKISEVVAGNGWNHFVPDEQIIQSIEERRQRVEETTRQRQNKVNARRQNRQGSRNKLQELKLLILGQKTVGKSATGNILLRKEIFATCANERCQEGKGEVDGRQVTVIDTPGWWKNSSQCTEDMDQEIVRGLSLCPSGAHAVLLVVPLDVRFTDSQWRAVEEHMSLFDATVWKHTLVVFTYGDMLADKSIEEHIENERYPLQWLVDKCENKYHVLNNTKKKDTSQITELFEKIEEMVAENSGRLFCPDMSDIHRRVEEKFRRREIKQVLKQRLEQEYRRRELELLTGFKQTLISLQTEMKQKSLMGDKTKIKAISIGQRKKDEKEKEEKIATKISQEIEKLDKEILKSTTFLRNSIDFLIPTMSEDPQTTSVAGSSLDSQNPSSNLDKVLGWLSTLQIGRNVENQLTLSFSETSGYRSLLADHFALNRDDDELE
ncbi:GTPase IMAP family member 8-like isoform X2 [Myripristis murdjan]|uniref:GTPase IMAP family member 8-like isoform X2 n=1 Tax=Myripristis murdjan TaxID=586833 RepID=UPI001175DD3E|nr:GTPase IMAP family member 8-like isoform X2 [Myripristis murdjan]